MQQCNQDKGSAFTVIHLIKVPGHATVPGYEVVDYIAKRGARGETSRDPPPESVLQLMSRPPVQSPRASPSHPASNNNLELADEMGSDDDTED